VIRAIRISTHDVPREWHDRFRLVAACRMP